ncbi:transporter substrate-binding domain-containing protein [Actinacidiphila acididurans]|uniref:Transporter substrate-binding domain-containing protein n=1 Tax=Actinacidiphila acididurans TaxID=2784346 RepID=A0ABS2TYA4_9ACTN|nr:transporter substrate-binding domain-containing protein [Actinacidiphila acididurans]MBM9508062.1 transporter substrate-binding domain-containing protein [Actinacidiphila acididurans]
MTPQPRPARRIARRVVRLAATAAVLAGLTLTAACGSSSSSDSSSDSAATPGAGSPKAQAGASAVPDQDVVSAVAADPALKAELPAAVRSSGVLTLGTTRTPGTTGLPHAGTTADGKLVGLDIDLREAVAKVLGVTWKPDYGTFASIIPGVQNGKDDVGMANFGATKAREQVVDFASYLTDGQSFLGAADLGLSKVTGLTDLCGHTVATTPGSTFQQILQDGAGKCAAAGKKPYTVQYFADTAPIFLGLANGKVDIFFGPTLGVKYDAQHVPGTTYLGQISSTTVGFVTAKGSPVAKALSDAVNKLIATGDYARIFAKWGVPDTGIAASKVNPPATF